MQGTAEKVRGNFYDTVTGESGIKADIHNVDRDDESAGKVERHLCGNR